MLESPRSKLARSPEAYLSRICPRRTIPGSPLLTVELLTYVVPYTFVRSAPFAPAASMKMRLLDTLPRNVAWRVQPTFDAVTSAVIGRDGVAKITRMSALLLRIDRICCVRFDCVATSYDSGST